MRSAVARVMAVTLGAGALGVDAAHADLPQEPSTYDLFVAEQIAYDSNLFRLPRGADLAVLAGPDAKSTDVIDSVSAGTDIHWFYANQAVVVHARVDENHYFQNQNLSNVSALANVDWNWQLGYRLSGEFGVDYLRALASFANTDYYARDMVDRIDYFGKIRYLLSSRWTVFGGVLGADTWQSAPALQIYDFRSKGANIGAEYASASDNKLTFEYKYINARFPQLFILNDAPFNSDYDENTASVTVNYAVSDATKLEVSGGYLRRNYPFSGFAAFSGGIGHISFAWQPSDAVQLTVSGRHELKAYVDAESDYFVSNGVTVEPAWKPREALSLSLAASYESHSYISSSPSALSLASRHDKVYSGQARLVYNPIRLLTASINYQFLRRDSNSSVLTFDDHYVTANVLFKFGL